MIVISQPTVFYGPAACSARILTTIDAQGRPNETRSKSITRCRPMNVPLTHPR
jgi:hypothetical protein